jgi:hypothetical protein
MEWWSQHTFCHAEIPNIYNILSEFKHLMSPMEYGAIVKDFKTQIKYLLKEVLDG